MIIVGLALLAIGVADLCAGGLGGEIANARKVVVAIAAGLITATIGLCTLTAAEPTTAVIVLVTVAAMSFAWSLLRLPRFRANRPWLAVVALVTPLGFLAASSGVLNVTAAAPAMSWLADLPFPAIARIGLDRLCLTAGAAVALLATANGVVRAVLASAGTLEQSENRLRGGRLIGPLERLMIFGLALAGDPTAAALVISAKSILRFPEISRAAGGAPIVPPESASPQPKPSEQPLAVDAVTEYFLLGSLSSWMLALAPVFLLRQ